MSGVFPLLALGLGSADGLQIAEGYGSEVVKTYSDPKELIFDGHEADMPRGQDFLFAMQVDPRAPEDYDDAVAIVQDSLPGWMRVALEKSSGDQECIVFVNDVNYFRLVISFYFDQWQVEDDGRVRSFIQGDAEDMQLAEAAFQEGVCRSVKSARDPESYRE